MSVSHTLTQAPAKEKQTFYAEQNCDSLTTHSIRSKFLKFDFKKRVDKTLCSNHFQSPIFSSFPVYGALKVQ